MASGGHGANRRIAAAGSALALAFACGHGADTARKPADAAAGASPVVARLNGEPITLDDLQVAYGGAPMRGDARQALDAAVSRRLVAEEARRRGLDATGDVQARIAALHRAAAAREDALLRDTLQGSLDAEQSVSEEELRAQYQQMPGRFSAPQLRLRRARFPTAEAARAEDQRLGADGRLDPASSEDIGPAAPEELMHQGMFGVMRLNQPGQRVVVPGGDGQFALLELEERLPPAPLPFEKVRPQLESQLRAQRSGEALEKLVAELRAKAKLEVDEKALDDAVAKLPAPGGPAMGRPSAL